MTQQLQLAEPLIEAMVTLLKANLNTTIDALNTAYSDAFTLDHAAQILPYVPIPSTLQGGTPAVGCQELPAQFEDDLQFSMHALHRYAVVAIIENSDQQTLAVQLRRIMQAIAQTIQADRMLGTTGGSGGIMRTQGRAWSVEFEATVPGPLLGDLDPLNPDGPPRSYMSWCAIELSSRRGEIG